MLAALQADFKANRPKPLVDIVLIVYRNGNWMAYECRQETHYSE